MKVIILSNNIIKVFHINLSGTGGYCSSLLDPVKVKEI